jgi:hypothetical protein
MLVPPLTPGDGEKPQKMTIEEVMAESLRSEESSQHRKGTFKIDATFEDAPKIIVKARPTSNKTNTHKG